VTRLVFVTQRVDPEHPALAATIPKIAALARRVDEVVVLAYSAEPSPLPDNVRVHTFGAGTKALRGLRFVRLLARELRPKPVAVVAHMSPIYAILAAPLARPLGVPVLLWFTHWKRSKKLPLALLLSSRVLSVDRRSFPIDSRKVRGIGHGIDVSEFTCTPPEPRDRLRALVLGRTSPAKGLETIIRGAELADVELEIRGPSLTEAERAERARLGDKVGGPVPRSEVPELFRRSDVLINNMRAGSPDKVVYEAAASCLPVLVSNPVFDDLVEPAQMFARESPESLAEALRRLQAADRAAIGRALRKQVERDHSVEHWADGVMEAAR
jgi:glycosyltransferase involved in cell wall biosynthesis